jgi:arylformamidase
VPKNYEAEYNNRARVPEHPAILQAWREAAAAFRSEAHPKTVSYGPGERETLDLFEVPGAPVVMFIHGGYWQAFDKSWFSHLARGPFRRGVSVAVPSYDLCPDVPLARIVGQMRQAARVLHERDGRPIVAAGHSAGGHLAACLLATDWSLIDRALPAGLVAAAYAISGLFDLEPLVSTSINQALRLDREEARRLSPLHWKAPPGGVLDAVVGEAESYEYHRQSEEIASGWAAQGVSTRFEEVTGANHFTIIAPLADPDSAMVARLVELAKGSGPGPRKARSPSAPKEKARSPAKRPSSASGRAPPGSARGRPPSR